VFCLFVLKLSAFLDRLLQYKFFPLTERLYASIGVILTKEYLSDTSPFSCCHRKSENNFKALKENIISTSTSIVKTCGIIILAAGASVRLGKPKQLLEFNGTTLLQHAVLEAVKSNAKPVIVVLGANTDLFSKEIDQINVHVVTNTEWGEGMASSIRMGLETVLHISPLTDAMIFMLCDQPYVSAVLLNDLIDTQIKTGKPIVASDYGNTAGPPALFHKDFFSELMQLKGDTGAKKVIQKHSDEVATVLFNKGGVDIDTMEDYEALKNRLS